MPCIFICSGGEAVPPLALYVIVYVAAVGCHTAYNILFMSSRYVAPGIYSSTKADELSAQPIKLLFAIDGVELLRTISTP